MTDDRESGTPSDSKHRSASDKHGHCEEYTKYVRGVEVKVELRNAWENGHTGF